MAPMGGTHIGHLAIGKVDTYAANGIFSAVAYKGVLWHGPPLKRPPREKWHKQHGLEKECGPTEITYT